MKHVIAAVATGVLIAGAAFADGHRNPAPEGARAYIVSPADGSTVPNPVTIVFGLEGMGVAPAGTEKEKTGHHHLLLNRPALGEGPDGADELLYGIPADDNHLHFGGGQTQVTLDLPAGEHTMQLVVGDLNHVPHDPPIMTEVITITVQ